LWEKTETGNRSRLLYGSFNGSSWDPPVVLTVTDSAKDETQVWVSKDEKTLIFNRRGVDAMTDLIRFTRDNTGDPWTSEFSIPLTGFEDGNSLRVWGEPTLSDSQDFIIFIRFDTSKNPWEANIMYSAGDVSSGFGAPVILN
jgi:hypothetical protein